MTHTFKLPSGVECEITEMTGKQQKILTEQNRKPHNEKLADMLVSVLVRVGDIAKPTVSFVKNEMLTCDRNSALVTLRQFSLDFEEEFIFMHKYKDTNGNKQEIEVAEKIEDGKFPFHPVQKLVAEATEDEDAIFAPAEYANYSEIEKDIFVTLPKSGQEVRFTLLDGKGEAIGIATKKTERSSHTSVYMRNPVYFKEGKDDRKIPIRLNLDDLAIKDIEFLRTQIKMHEGRVDSEILFENEATGKNEVLDVIGSVAFFFPSEAI